MVGLHTPRSIQKPSQQSCPSDGQTHGNPPMPSAGLFPSGWPRLWPVNCWLPGDRSPNMPATSQTYGASLFLQRLMTGCSMCATGAALLISGGRVAYVKLLFLLGGREGMLVTYQTTPVPTPNTIRVSPVSHTHTYAHRAPFWTFSQVDLNPGVSLLG